MGNGRTEEGGGGIPPPPLFAAVGGWDGGGDCRGVHKRLKRDVALLKQRRERKREWRNLSEVTQGKKCSNVMGRLLICDTSLLRPRLVNFRRPPRWLLPSCPPLLLLLSRRRREAATSEGQEKPTQSGRRKKRNRGGGGRGGISALSLSFFCRSVTTNHPPTQPPTLYRFRPRPSQPGRGGGDPNCLPRKKGREGKEGSAAKQEKSVRMLGLVLLLSTPPMLFHSVYVFPVVVC